MCYKVGVQVVIANYFADCENATELSKSKLKSLNSKIKEQFIKQGKFLVIEESDECIDGTIHSYPNYFSYSKNKQSILFNKDRLTEFYEDVYGVFNSQVNHKIKFKFLSILEKVLEEESNVKEFV
jgi:ribosomal protein S8